MRKISIVIPVYNTEKYLRRCLDSCLEQNIPYSDYEIVLVNDGSTDNSLSIINEYTNKHSNIVSYSQENMGLSMARNTGVSHAKGEFIWFVDSDDWILKDCLFEIVNKCREKQLDILSFCAADVIDGPPKRRYSYPEKGVMTGEEVIEYALFPPCAPFSVYKRGFLVENNLSFYPGIFHEDSEFQPRAYYFAKRVFLSNTIYYYVFHSTNSIGRSYNPKKAFDQLIVMERLHSFMEDNMADSNGFHYRVGLVLNNSLSEACVLDSESQKLFNEAVEERDKLLIHLKKSRILKYIIEYYLFKLLPGKYIQIYKFLRKLK